MVGPNFDCGSSREHAVWGLKQVGIRALIGTSLAGIFYDNCQRNGVLALQVSEEQLKQTTVVIRVGKAPKISVNLPDQRTELADGSVIPFHIDELRQTVAAAWPRCHWHDTSACGADSQF